MEILEFGDKANKKIILIHGFQSPYQVWNRYIERYKGDFHVIVPILPGHNPREEEDFVSFTQTAKEIEDYCISCYGNEVYAVFAMSMGGVLAATIENYIRSIGDYKLPSDIDTPETKVYFFHGTKMNEVLAKKTVKYIKKHYLGAVIKCFEGKGHCENSLLEPELMMQELSGIL